MAQVHRPNHVDSGTGQETYVGISTNNLSNSHNGTTSGVGHVGTLRRYEIEASGVSTSQLNSTIRLGWTAPASGADLVKMVEFQILPGRHKTRDDNCGNRSYGVCQHSVHPARIVDSCPSGDNSNFYRITNSNSNMLDLSQDITLQKCSNWWNVSQQWGTDYDRARHSIVIRLMGESVKLDDGGYAASFGPHNSIRDCSAPTWPSQAHQTDGEPPYAEWCDVSIWWWVRR